MQIGAIWVANATIDFGKRYTVALYTLNAHTALLDFALGRGRGYAVRPKAGLVAASESRRVHEIENEIVSFREIKADFKSIVSGKSGGVGRCDDSHKYFHGHES